LGLCGVRGGAGRGGAGLPGRLDPLCRARSLGGPGDRLLRRRSEEGLRLMRIIDREEVARRLTYELCIPIVREAMIAFSTGETRQLLRSIIPLAEGRMFGIMPGALGEHAAFGAKVISVFPENFAKGRQSHQGLVVLFEPKNGAPVCVVHAGEVTAI